MEILKLHSSPDVSYAERLQARNLEILTGALEKLSKLTEKYASSLLDGKKIDFIELGQFRDKECAEYALLRDVRYAREDAKNAWADKNYFAVVKAYKPFETVLTEVERKRLAFAEKQLTVPKGS